MLKITFAALELKSWWGALQEDCLWPLCAECLLHRASFFFLLGRHLNKQSEKKKVDVLDVLASC